MASTIKLKNSTSSGVAPSSLVQGELAINVEDGNLFYGTKGGTAVSQSFEFSSITAANITAATRFIQGEDNINTIYAPIAGGTAITTVGTIGTGGWNGNIISSSKLDADTAHLTTNQTFTGNKTFSAAITASGAISASGGISGSSAQFKDTYGIETDKIRRASDSSNTTKILLNDEVVKINAGHASNESVNIQLNEITITPPITASGAISSSGDIQTAYTGSFGHVVASSLSGVQSGKQYRIVNANFRDDIGTDKHYLPMNMAAENAALTREEVSELAVMDGRLVSATVRLENVDNSVTGDFDLTMGVETNVINASYTNFTEQETETLTATHTDDHHVFHFTFTSSKHWDATDQFAVSIESSVDKSETNERYFITLVIEDDWSTYLAGSSREIDSTP